jgi:hypothetical protein
MPNIHGVLQGATDPSQEGWQERVLERVRERQRRQVSTRRRAGLQLAFDMPFRHLLDEAAHRRGMSLSGYARRAIAAFVAHDLGLPFPYVTQNFPRVNPYGQVVPLERGTRTVDDGEGFGEWKVSDV